MQSSESRRESLWQPQVRGSQGSRGALVSGWLADGAWAAAAKVGDDRPRGVAS